MPREYVRTEDPYRLEQAREEFRAVMNDPDTVVAYDEVIMMIADKYHLDHEQLAAWIEENDYIDDINASLRS